jgi:hypothetical protein
MWSSHSAQVQHKSLLNDEEQEKLAGHKMLSNQARLKISGPLI